MAKIDRIGQLKSIFPEPSARALLKQLNHLDRHCRQFIELSPFLVLATAGRGKSDASPRGGSPGFVWVVDSHSLVIPEWTGNNRIDSLKNILESSCVGLLFFIPGVEETLRVNGRATIRDDSELRDHFSTNGRLPRIVLYIEVLEAFLQCAKAIIRAKLWEIGVRGDRSGLPTMGEMLKEQCQFADPPETQDAMLARYRDQLY